MQGIVEVGQSGVDAGRGLIDLCRTFHAESFVRTFLVEDITKLVEAGLLLKKVGGCGFGGFFFQSQMHAFMTTVLLGMARLDAFDTDP